MISVFLKTFDHKLKMNVLIAEIIRAIITLTIKEYLLFRRSLYEETADN